MLTKRIIPCLDVKNGVVVKGVQFVEHTVVGDILELAKKYRDDGADEIVFYDITASSDMRSVSLNWISEVAKLIDIPFCVAGGIRDIITAKAVLNAGADKISINSPALENPVFITQLAETFGTQCVVIGIDSYTENDNYYVYQYTGDAKKTLRTGRATLDWAQEVQSLGAGEIVLNCINQDGMRHGYDIPQLQKLRQKLHIPLIASGGAGNCEHFVEVFQQANVDGALAASIFHSGQISIKQLKKFLRQKNIEVRL
jgi:imidazole glycerol-phosphate synthase subunit HisF